jgi:hypothetical protein
MATWTTYYSLSAALANKVHNLASDTLTVALTTVAPNLAHTQLSDLTQISYTSIGSRVITITSCTQSSGLCKLILVDKDIQNTGTATAAGWRYAHIYNDTATNDELIGYLDMGSTITLNPGDKETLDFSAANGVLQIAVVT